MKLKIAEKLRAIALREKGYSLNEIIKEVGVAKSSVSEWVRNVPLTSKAQDRLLTKIKLGQFNAAVSKRRKVEDALKQHRLVAEEEVLSKKIDKLHKKIICSLLYWCEGAKDHYQGVTFTNSDPQLIKTFLQFFREGFIINEERLRVCVHLHEYHDMDKQLRFWSMVTKIPLRNFIKPYLKPNSGKRIHKDYPGCVSIRYGSNDMARQLSATAQVFLTNYGGVGNGSPAVSNPALSLGV